MTNLRQGAWIGAADGRFAFIDEHANWARRPGNLESLGMPTSVWESIHVTYDYNKKPFGDWDNFKIVPLFPVNPLPAAPAKEPASEIDLGAPRTESVLSRIHLPEGFGADVPDAIHVKT